MSGDAGVNVSRGFSAIALAAAWGIAAACMGVAVLAAIFVGSTGGAGWPEGAVVGLRLAVVIPAAIVGVALGAAGAACQQILRNPLADPYLLGASTGAALASYSWTIAAPATIVGAAAAMLGQPAAAFVAAVATVAVVLGVAQRRGRLEPIAVLLVGVIVNAILGAVLMLIVHVWRDPATPGGAMGVLVGAIVPLTTGQMAIAGTIVAAAVTVLAAIAGRLGALGLSDAEAGTMGVNVNRLRWTALLAATLATAAAVACSGPVAFVGLIGPHVARRVVGGDLRRLLPASCAAGAVLLVLADAACRLASRAGLLGTMVPVGIVTAMIGGVFFLGIMGRRGAR